LNGALLALKPNRVEMVATDGHRLPLAAREVEIAGLKSEERLLVPKRALAGLRRLANAQQSDSPIHIAKDDSHLFFSAGDSILISRMLAGQFPDYGTVLPKNNTITATLDAAAFRESMRRVALLASEQTHAVCLALDSGRLTLNDLEWGYRRGFGIVGRRFHRCTDANWLQCFVSPRHAQRRQDGRG